MFQCNDDLAKRFVIKSLSGLSLARILYAAERRDLKGYLSKILPSYLQWEFYHDPTVEEIRVNILYTSASGEKHTFHMWLSAEGRFLFHNTFPWEADVEIKPGSEEAPTEQELFEIPF